jgi:uncharacterized protein YydD (DUF2326 family)
MKLSRLYSNDDRFHSIVFNDGMNLVLGKVTNTQETSKDSHNLGKSTLASLLDFMMLKQVGKDFFLKKYERYFENHIFYLEIHLNNGKFLTICRTVANSSKASFVKTDDSTICNEETDWTEENLPLAKAKEYLNSQLSFDVLNNWDYRQFISFFLRTQRDYADEFQLSKFKGKHSNWKPAVFAMLGYDEKPVKLKYDLDEKVANLKKVKEVLQENMAVSPSDYDKIKSTIDVRKEERDKMQKEIDAFNFYAEEKKINKVLIDDIEKEIAELNSKLYALSFTLDKAKSSLERIPSFDTDELRELYKEAGIIWPDKLVHSYKDLLNFSINATTERNKYLQEHINETEREIARIDERLKSLDKRRNEELSLLQGKDTFRKFKAYEKRLAKLEGEIAQLQTQLENINNASQIDDRIEQLNSEIKNAEKQIRATIEKGAEIPASIKSNFNNIISSIFDVSALLYVKPNSSGNVDFYTQIAPDDNSEATAQGFGNSYKKFMCAAFDLSVLAAYSNKSFFRFVYHDGILEGIDNRKKKLFIETVRHYCQTYNIQYIFSSIEDDLIGGDSLKQFTDKEKCLVLSDEDDSGRLFGFSY